jgi:hypothetical protein
MKSFLSELTSARPWQQLLPPVNNNKLRLRKVPAKKPDFNRTSTQSMQLL